MNKVTLLALTSHWMVRGPVTLGENSVLLHNGYPNQKTQIGNPRSLNYDDYVEINIKAKIDKMMANSKSNESASDRMNGFFIQLSSQTDSLDPRFDESDSITLNGLVLMILSHDSHNELSQNEQTYFVTYRYFPRPTTLSREYITILFDSKGELIRQIRHLSLRSHPQNC